MTESAWWLPDFIPRYFEIPRLPQVNPEATIKLEPSLARCPDLETIRDELRKDRIKYANGSSSFVVRSRTISGGLVTLADRVEANRPFARPNFAFLLDNGGLFPFHATPFSAYCANLPLEPLVRPASPQASVSEPTRPQAPDSGAIAYDIRVLRLKFNNMSVITCFREWVYHQDDVILQMVLMPHLATVATLETLKHNSRARWDLANNISASYTELQMWNYIYTVLDFRDLMVTLGVDDLRVWAAMEVAWDVMLQGLNASCVREAQRDAARGVDTSKAKEWLNRGLGFFESGGAWQNLEDSRVRAAETPQREEGSPSGHRGD